MKIDAEVMPKGTFGGHIDEPRIERAHGAHGTTRLRFGQRLSSVEVVNLLEEPVAREGLSMRHDGDIIDLQIRPFEVVTLRVQT